MFMKERIIAFCAALLMMLQCCIAGASELKKEPDMLLTNERTWDIRNAQYTIFAKPPVGWVGDVMPMVGDEDSGELRLFYLQDWRDGKPTYHPFHSLPPAISCITPTMARISPSQTSAITTWHWVPAR